MVVDRLIVDTLKKEKKVVCGFSTGKDSVCCAAILRDLDVEYIPIYYYLLPNLEFVQRSIDMYERFFDIKIVQLPHPTFYAHIVNQDFQRRDMANWICDQKFYKIDFDEQINNYLEYIGDDTTRWNIVGVRAAESFQRRMTMRNSNGIDEDANKIFPIYNWKVADVKEYLDKRNIPLTEDYKLWNRSYEGLSYRFVCGIKRFYPSDYKKLLEVFPLLDLEIFRYEQNKKYF
jgi:3'-phosphoadenosine 5'-phosphosulfate sulfotransferase (PAPS reductase)/FAD synthetase